ncbi:lytic murein transglycosylase [Limibacillus halophilus]|uniref:Membrane-bound lytic murein transglycosylase B n=1 Tax=Limibacillus halophilus TaxID=1579333 RepID=A0A839SUF6_9PROT|nr:lytic murein transglycosylase [Limibacillus halophilus]MBB3065639.1 membrane-bound lytic murein transglycosylase B [Limibacillus halophilus]
MMSVISKQSRFCATLLSGAIITFLLAATTALPHSPSVEQNALAPDFEPWLEQLREEALQRGISAATIQAALSHIKPLEKVLKKDRNQAEFKLTFASYSARVLTAENIDRGRALLQEHATLLNKVSQSYGVQPRFIVAIWGLETRYGAITGSDDILPGLTTLAYDRRRSQFFREQVFAALQMVDKGYIELSEMRGSWAGAMGQPQFMPTSYMEYAQDFDGDGRRDIWNNLGDVFASIANYLSRHGWSDDLTWGRPIRLPVNFQRSLDAFAYKGEKGCRAERSMTITKILPEWQALGIRNEDGSDLPSRPIPAAIVQPDGPDGGAFLVYSNYRSVLRYNCAHLYALTVGTLADKLDDR